MEANLKETSFRTRNHDLSIYLQISKIDVNHDIKPKYPVTQHRKAKDYALVENFALKHTTRKVFQ